MDKPYARRAVAFSPDASLRKPYIDSILELLGFDEANPPTGFMMRLLDELESGEKHPELKLNLLILDNFMPSGVNEDDLALLHTLKANIKESTVAVLILTPDSEVAYRLIAQNELGVIVPLATTDQINQLRRANPKIHPSTPLVFDWNQEVSMVWDKDELKKAVEHGIAFLELAETQQDAIRRRFDNVYSSLSQEDKDTTNPIKMLQQFHESQMEGPSTPRAGPDPSGASGAGDQGGCCGTGMRCTIL